MKTAPIGNETARAGDVPRPVNRGAPEHASILGRDLAESKTRYQTLTENAHDMISVLSPGGWILEVNRRCEEILGRPAAEVVGHHIREFAAPGSESANVEIHDELVASGSGRTPPVALRHANGNTVLVEFSSITMEIDGHRQVMTIGRDVTEQVRSRAQLMVSDRMASIGTLAAGVAHEINNPLAAVIGNLEIASQEFAAIVEGLKPTEAIENTRVSLEEGLAAAERVAQIVKDLKIFARAEEAARGPVDVRAAMESTLRMAWNEIRHRAKLVQEYGDVPPVDANEARLGQVMLNLVMNAVQAIPEGKADDHEIRVATRTDPEGRVLIEVSDTGAGMAPDVVQRLFTPFFTAKPHGEGTGLGLAICHRIVTGLGGEISVTSRPGAGTKFTVILPVLAGAVAAAAGAPKAALPATRRARLLVVDDDPLVGSMVQRVLSPEHDVAAMTSARVSLDRIAAGERFDAILCDLMMPVMTGMDFYDALRGLAPDQAERVIFLTGGAFTDRARAFLDRTPNPRMEKPFRAHELRAAVNERLG